MEEKTTVRTDPNQSVPNIVPSASTAEPPTVVISSRARKNIALKREVEEMQKDMTGTDDLLQKLLKAGKTLRALRDKRDQLREILAHTEQEIVFTAAEVQDFTALLADQQKQELNGKGKK